VERGLYGQREALDSFVPERLAKKGDLLEVAHENVLEVAREFQVALQTSGFIDPQDGRQPQIATPSDQFGDPTRICASRASLRTDRVRGHQRESGTESFEGGLPVDG
jgi:hypothetical protein